ncbi:hypothetical protein BJV82DRAFT_341975 [Fennellomyces sp. T-0311]|nr:hypothetical protein BJV82DRAFT_341975 [Fennellomyces sp. T-0311]
MWLAEMKKVVVDAKNSREIKKQGPKYLTHAMDMDDDLVLNLADVIYRLSPRFCIWHEKRVVEATFIQNHLGDLVDVIFGDNELLSHEWTSKRMANVFLTVSDESTTKKVVIPDYLVSVMGKHKEKLNVFAIDVKAPGRNQVSDDYYKLAEEIKQMVDILASHGIMHALVCGLLVDGN